MGVENSDKNHGLSRDDAHPYADRPCYISNSNLEYGIMTRMLRPHDFVILLKLTTLEAGTEARQLDLALALGLSQGEVNKALGRLSYAGLYSDVADSSPRLPRQRRHRFGRVNKHALLDVLLHGVRYILPVRPGAETRGVATAWGALPLAAEIVHQADHVPVWPYADGTSWGPSVEPLHASAPYAATHDPRIHELLALVDALRIGRARERALATKYLSERLSYEQP